MNRLLFNLKNQQAALSASERSYHNLFHHAPIPLYEADYSAVMEEIGHKGPGSSVKSNTRISSPDDRAASARLIRVNNINSTACTLFGVSGPDDFQEFLTEKILHDDEMRRTFIAILDVLLNKSPQTGTESLITDKSGARRHIIQRWLPMPHADQKMSSILVAVIDVTEIRELQAQQAAHDEMERREIDAHKSFLAPPHTTLTANTYGSRSIREQYPDMFDQWVEKYKQLLTDAADSRIFKTHGDVAPKVKSLVDEIGFFRAGPRDIIDIHTTSLKKLNDTMPGKKTAHMTEGRILLLELMGYLLSRYRNLAMGK